MPTPASGWRTAPSSSCCSSNARRAERLSRLALLRRANSAAGILRPARRHARSRLPRDRSLGWWHTQASQLGPASSIRSIWDLAAAPLAELLGFTAPSARGDGPDTRHASLMVSSGRIALVAATWKSRSTTLWRERRGEGSVSTRHGCSARTDASCASSTHSEPIRARIFSSIFNGRPMHPPTFAVLWGVLREEAFRRGPGDSPRARHHPLLCAARTGCQPIVARRRHRVGAAPARRAQQMRPSTRSGQAASARLFDESLTVVYRVLFLMFAESRNLVPNWHPIYRESYTVESLRERAERHGKVPGLWEALQAIARLAHNGCRAGSLVVPPFNGRLFSPSRSPIAESCAVDDEVARQALLSLSTTTAGRPKGRTRDAARASTIATSASNSSARCTKACSITSPRMQTRAAARFCFGEAATRASRPARSTRRKRSPITWCGAPCIRWSTERQPIAFFSFASWIQRWAAPPFSSRRADISPARTSGRWFVTGWPTPQTSTKSSARSSGGSSRSDASSAST